MIEVLAPAIAATSAAVFVGLSARGERRRLLEQLYEERNRVGNLLLLVEAQRAPQEFASYLDPRPPAEPPAGRFSDDGLIWFPEAEVDS